MNLGVQKQSVFWVFFVVLLLQVVTIVSFGLVAFVVHSQVLFSLGFMAYIFGLRHALDADHIAAIDNTTRKLMADGKRPAGTGLFFSLGHSSIVVLLTLIAALSFHTFTGLHRNVLFGTVSTVISASYLYLIGGMNVVPFCRAVQKWLILRKNKNLSHQPNESESTERTRYGGLATRLFYRLFSSVRSSGQMFFIGALFGLGFETASEVSVLAMSASAYAQGLPILYVLLFPLSFTAGMSLLDTVDGVLMLYTYQLVNHKVSTRNLYNAIVTGISILTAFFVGSLEWIQLVGQGRFSQNPIVRFANSLDFGMIGCFIVSIFLVFYLVLVWKRPLRSK